ncbi:BA14K-like protein [Breoghania corrubedonensis]|uniref:Lectin-like protein BA14k n=1 Tax=Breoghania corrubedonensis TaxID=665038 RepID=A0A2T5V520_9HYPH|nr:BA14K family protein [Breoghania corrubedonensis]PTW58830.1 BA14K-like protein [Breoghania corrubedonensis]
MLKTGSKVWRAISVALALSLSTVMTVPPAFAGDSDNSPEMSGRYNWQQRDGRDGRRYRAERRHRVDRDRDRSRSYRRDHRRDWDRRRHRNNNNAGAAILGGILGLGAGLAIGNATAPRSYDGGRYPAWSDGWYRYCESRYRSFNPRTGYFLGYDGQYHFCRAR